MRRWTLLLTLVVLGLASPDQEHRTPLLGFSSGQGSADSYPVHRFVTVDVEGPQIHRTKWSSECDDGQYLFISPRGWSVKKPGPMILDSSGDVVWSKRFENEYGGQAYDFRVQKYLGEDHLTFWLGDDRIRGHGFGYYFMLNSSYDIVRKVGAANGSPADLHEFLITPEGTALMIVYQVIPWREPLPGNGFANRFFGVSYLWDNIIQEVDIASGRLLFEWRASEHVSINDTYHDMLATGTQSEPFDWFHVNSVDKDESGNYIICSRYTHSVYYIDGATKEITWTLGGKQNDFADMSDGHALNFAWQHDARLVPHSSFPKFRLSSKLPRTHTSSLLTLFDNAAEDWNYAYGPKKSRGLLLDLTWPSQKTEHALTHDASSASLSRLLEAGLSELDAAKISAINHTSASHTVRVVKEYIDEAPIRSSSQGSMQLVKGGKNKNPNIFIGYGLAAVLAEFDSDGQLLCELRFGSDSSWEKGDVQTYRAYKFPWSGKPREPPSMAVKGNTLYISWNGALDVKTWRLQAATSPGEWQDEVLVAKQGFETSFDIPPAWRAMRFLRVQALDTKDKECDHGEATFDHGRVSALVRQHVTTTHGNSFWLFVSCFIIGLGLYTVYVVYRISGRRGLAKSARHRVKAV